MARLHRRNFLSTVMLNLLLWISTILIVIFLNPDNNLQFAICNSQLHISPNVILFFIALTLSLSLTLTLLFGNTRQGLLLALLSIGSLILHLVRVLNLFTFALLFLTLLIIEIFSSKK